MSSQGRFRLLFTPLRVGPVVIPNRIVFAAHLTNYAADGLPTRQHVAYYEARARGGAGLIITEEHSTHPTDWPYEKMIHGFHREVIPGYRAITEAVQRHGTRIFAQINHNGGQGSGMYNRLATWAPSAVPDPLFREVPYAVEPADIAAVIAGYAATARNCAEGGFDGVELQCSHSSIVRQFLSPSTNRRRDEYGGSVENRARLLVEIVAAVRQAIGPGRALGVRLCGDELLRHGITLEETVAVARLLEAGGGVDYINTSIGVATATLHMIEGSMHVPPGYTLFIPAALREHISLPVIGVGRIKDPVQADRALRDGHCDLVGVVRGQIADPDFAAKSRAGLTEEIRLCLSCNQECVGRMGLNRWLGCIENPRAGRESLAPRPRAAARPRRVLVVGAGPAGLQAAISAAEHGHRVTVLERQAQPGGNLRLAASVPNRAEIGDLIRNQVIECARLGVEIRCGVAADAALVRQEAPEVVIVATGSTPGRPFWVPAETPAGEPRVADVTEVLQGAASPSGSVVVVDEIGFHHATSVAELLADRGCRVEVLTSGMVVGQDLGITLDMEGWLMRAHAKGIALATDLVVTGLEDGELRLLHHPTGRLETRRPDWVVLAVPARPADSLYHELAGLGGFEVFRVGDCVAPRRAHAAVIDGDRIGGRL
jgi:mycofactocin system FadH/OYE family oxidoreductase 2